MSTPPHILASIIRGNFPDIMQPADAESDAALESLVALAERQAVRTGDLLTKDDRYFVECRRQILNNQRKGYEPEWLEIVDRLAPKPAKAPQIPVDQLDENELQCIAELEAVLPPFGNPDYVDIHCYAENVVNILKRRFTQLK